MTMTYNLFKMIHTIIGGLLLGGGISFLVLLASLRKNASAVVFELFTQWHIRLFFLLILPLIFFQIILALILISLKTPAVSSGLVGALFLALFAVFSFVFGGLFYLKMRFENLYHHRLLWVVWIFCFILTGFILGFMVYKMVEIGLQAI
jgi:hypothetical protein